MNRLLESNREKVDIHDAKVGVSPILIHPRALVKSIGDKLQTIMSLPFDISSTQNNPEEQEQIGNNTIIMKHLHTILANEPESSFIERPMERECRVAVMIPAYNESYQNILRSLSSLALQKGVSSSDFEVDIIVNNSKRSSEQKTAEFLMNQRSLNLINYINGNPYQVPDGLTEQSRQIEEIRKSKIRINIIDKSSLKTSYEENNVGIARNRAGAEISHRFMTVDAGSEGIIAITDCDCTFSDNYISTLIRDFGENKINGLSGNLRFELDPTIVENRESIQRAFDIYMGKRRDEENEDRYKDEPNFKPEKYGALRSGANMAVPVRVWASVDGMPKLSGGEDMRFGKMIEDVDGTCAKDYGYTITSLIRVSERTGIQGNGRIVKKIKDTVDAFVSGESDGVLIEDREKVNIFFGDIVKAGKEGLLSGRQIMEFMQSCDFKKNEISEKKYDELAQKINAELRKPENEWNIKALEEMVFERIYPYYPERDITNQIVK